MSITTQPANLTDQVKLLSGIPLFETLPEAELESLAAQFVQTTHRKGEVLFKAGDEGGDFFVVARGELEVLGAERNERVLNRLGPGDHLGEIALLLGGRRTATVRVSRTARLLTLGADDFHELMERHPAIPRKIASGLARQLDVRTRDEVPSRTSLVVAVTGARGLKGKTLVSDALATLLADQTGKSVLVVDGTLAGGTPLSEIGGVMNGSGATPRSESAGRGRVARLSLAASGHTHIDSPDLPALVERAQPAFPVVILDLGSRTAASPPALGELCDVVVEIVAQADAPKSTRYGPSTRVLPVVNLHNPLSRPFPVNRSEPFLLRDDPALRGLERQQVAAYIREHPRSPAGPALHRLARRIRGNTIGVAIGGGAAFGIAAIGVLQALEQAGIPLDIVAGTSMGSIIGAAYAVGLSADEIAERFIHDATTGTELGVIDPAAARPGLLAGNRLSSLLRDEGLGCDFEELALPYRALAADIESGEPVAIGTGEVATACRASSSVPLVFAPVSRDGRLLVDGGAVYQVPVPVVREMGADIVIAVTFVPTLHRGTRTVFSRVSNAINAFNPLSYLAHARGLPSTIDLFMNLFTLIQNELGCYQAMAADAHIEVDTADFTWVSFHRAAELIARGKETGERHLPAIERLLAERPLLAG